MRGDIDDEKILKIADAHALHGQALNGQSAFPGNILCGSILAGGVLELSPLNKLVHGVSVGRRPNRNRSEGDPTNDLVLHDSPLVLAAGQFGCCFQRWPGNYWTRRGAKRFNWRPAVSC
jgi:hypothetical protein